MTASFQHESIYKVGHLEPEAGEYRFDNAFARQDRSGTQLLCVTTSGSPVEVIKKLLDRLPEPFWFLYVLSVPRGEGEPGRYQSEKDFSREETKAFVEQFKNYLGGDARHNFWIKAEHGPGLLVLDEHNFIYSYGPVNEWANDLEQMGWREIPGTESLIPVPHQHYFHEIFDDDATRILKSLAWIHSPLQEQDRN